MSMEFKVRTWLWVVLVTIVVLGGGFTYWYNYANKGTATIKTSPTATTSALKTSPSPTTVSTADWQTYKNDVYGFSLKYPSSWNITEKEENFNDERKYIVNLNNDSTTNQSYFVEVFNSDKAAKQFVESYYGGLEGGPSYITEENINNTPVIKFFMEKASIGSPAGNAIILFKQNSTIVAVGMDIRTGSSGQSISDFWNTISNDTTLDQIVSTFQFTK